MEVKAPFESQYPARARADQIPCAELGHGLVSEVSPVNTERITKLEKLLSADPNDAFVLYSLAQEFGKAGAPGETAKALVFYDRCIAADPNYCYAYYHKAKLLGDNDRNEEAIQTLKVGMTVAKAAKDGKALNEIAGLLDQME